MFTIIVIFYVKSYRDVANKEKIAVDVEPGFMNK